MTRRPQFRPNRLRLLLCLLGLLSFEPRCIAIYEAITAIDIEDIQERGKLKVITSYGANSYFIYRGQPMGYEYELLERLAQDLGVELEIVVTRDLDNIVYMLNSGLGDLVASNLVVTRKRAREVVFTGHLMTTRQVLVQRQAPPPEPADPGGDRSQSPPGDRTAIPPAASPGDRPRDFVRELFAPGAAAPHIRDPIDLIGKTVHVRGGSAYYERLRHLEEEIGGDIDIVTVAGDVTTEELIRKVHAGEIDYTIADEPTALINRAYYADLDVFTAVSFPQRVAWVVRRNSPELLAAVNQWIQRVQQSGELAALYERYYRNERAFRERVDSEFYFGAEGGATAGPAAAGGKISIFDREIRAAARELGWDWRLLAALIYQESRFNPRARSWAGAAGLMQLMPATGSQYALRDFYDPAENIRAGTAHLKWLSAQWEPLVPDPAERLKFILAAYNAGSGHVEDARNLARAFGKDPLRWDRHTAPFLLRLADPRYYNRAEVQYGYCRGEEPFQYVKSILALYGQYRDFVAADPGDAAPAAL